MKVATFNVNNVVKRLPNLLEWLAESRPDVVCLQELKTEQGSFPERALLDAGYTAVWRGERNWNGVAILSRVGQPVVTQVALPGDEPDRQSRYIEAAVNGVIIGCIYLPNGNPQPGPKFDYKLAWFRRLVVHADKLFASGAPVILAGDFNVVPTDADIYNTRSWKKNALLQPESRAAYQRLLAQGWADALAEPHADSPLWTFWSYFRDSWDRDAGLRIDHLLLTPELAESVVAVGVDRDVRGHVGASDHAPAWVVLGG